jgi:hypothetical protein
MGPGPTQADGARKQRLQLLPSLCYDPPSEGHECDSCAGPPTVTDPDLGFVTAVTVERCYREPADLGTT